MNEESKSRAWMSSFDVETLIFDGAMGTMLIEQSPGQFPVESLNQSSPELVRSIHQQYIRAGAHVIRTNTFGANRLNLGMYDLAHQVVTFNRGAVELAREAVKRSRDTRPIIVAGSIGPVNRRAISDTRINCCPADAYAEQAHALIEAGVDMLICETFHQTTDIEELFSAVLPLAKAVKRNIPVALCITPSDDFVQAAESAVALFESILRTSGVDFFGLNCGSGPDSIVKPILEMRERIDVPLLALPSAGIPITEGDSLRYPIGIEEFCSRLQPLIDTRIVAGIGGCCGTTPDYVAALAVLNRERMHN